MDRLTSEQAYEAMVLFLEDVYERTRSDDVAGLLSDMQLVADGRPADPAAWDDWSKAVRKALAASA